MKAVYYCRVSTEEESQVNALESQIEEAINCIENNNWTLIDGYVDEGKSGTQTKKRDEYNRLFNELESDKFDVIVVKSQDRLMRNTKDWYVFIDKLVTNSKKLFFYIDNKFYTPDDALITGIKAILAEEYSRELSKKLNNAHRGRQSKGKSVIITNKTWGYDKINKEVVINEKEAEIVRLIYDLCIDGYGSRTISKELSNRGIKSRTGNDFAEVTIRKIIRNPLFKGTAVMNKRHKDFNTEKTIHNPESKWKIHENAVPAIVTAEIWEQANKTMDKRSQKVRGKEFSERQIGKNIGKYNLSSKIICGECSSVYWRRYRKNTKGEQIVDWSCSEYVKRGRKNIEDTRGKNKLIIETKEGGCDNIHIKEEDLNNILCEASKKFFKEDKNNAINIATSVLESVFNIDNIEKDIQDLKNEKEKIINQKNMLLDKLLEDIITNEDYKRKDSELERRLQNIKVNEESILDRQLEANNYKERIENIKSLLKLKETDAISLPKFIKHIDRLIIFENYIEIYLDLFDPMKAYIETIGGKKIIKTCQYVDSTIHLIPHTDKYRYEGKYREVSVKLVI